MMRVDENVRGSLTRQLNGSNFVVSVFLSFLSSIDLCVAEMRTPSGVCAI